MKRTLLILVLLFISTLTIQARDFNVRLAVQADTAEITAAVEQFLLDELRLLKDVKITEEGDWDLRVMVMENKVPEGAEKSFTISAVITSGSNCAAINSRDSVVLTQACDKFENFGIFAGRMADLKEMCAELIADFDANSLGPRRLGG